MRQDLTIWHLQKNALYMITAQIGGNRKNEKKLYNANTKHKKLCVTILTSDTVDFKTNSITRDRHLITIFKNPIHQEDRTILNMANSARLTLESILLPCKLQPPNEESLAAFVIVTLILPCCSFTER